MKKFCYVMCLYISIFIPSFSFAIDLNAGFSGSPLTPVITATRLKQSRNKTPASVTIITDDMLRSHGIRSLPDALRLVPGMIVGMASGNEYRINYHGTNGLVPRRMQVLVDGTPVYEVSFARIDWMSLPVGVDDIERIEVIRSPNSAAYGANAFLAVVHIITKHPDMVPQFTGKITAGSLNTQEYFTRFATRFRNTSALFSLSHMNSAGFDRNYLNENRRDGSSISRFNFRTDTLLTLNRELTFTGSINYSEFGVEFRDNEQQTFPDLQKTSTHFSANYILPLSPRNELRFAIGAYGQSRQQDWQECRPYITLTQELRDMYQSNPDYAFTLLQNKIPTGGSAEDDALAQAVLNRVQALGDTALSPVCGRVNEDGREVRYLFEFQNTSVFSSNTRTVYGVTARYDTVDHQTLFNGNKNYYALNLFATLEQNIGNSLTINIGGNAEREEKHTDGFVFSPRGALNFHLSQSNTLRLLYSESIRTPDLLANDIDWTYTAKELDPLVDGNSTRPFFVRQRGAGELKSEKVKSREFGYLYQSIKNGVQIDIKYFYDELTHLISEKPTYFEHLLSNNNTLRLKGVDLGASVSLFRKLQFYLAYAYVDSKHSHIYEKSLYSRHTGAGSIAYTHNNKTDCSFVVYGYSALNGVPYRRYDTNISHRIKVGRAQIRLFATMTLYDYKTSKFVVDETFSVENTYEDRLHLFGGLEMAY